MAESYNAGARLNPSPGRTPGRGRLSRSWESSVLLGVLLALHAPAGRAEDSVTSACQQNSAYCALLTGQEASVPTVRGGAEMASLAATLRLLTPELVTRAMQWGTEKHGLALECAQGKLDALVPGRFSLEPRYRYDPRTGQTQWLSPQEVRALLRQDCGKELKGTLVPDIVIHSGNPLEVSAIYDFKFPCPSGNDPLWRPSLEGSTSQGLNQGQAYVKALKADAALVSPRAGIQQRISP